MLGRRGGVITALVLASLAALALALAFLASPPAVAAPSPLTTASALAPGLERLAASAVRSRSRAGQAAALGMPTGGAGSLVREGGRVVVEARFESGALAAVGAVRAAGARVLDASRRYQTLALSIAPGDLRALAAVPRISSVTPSLAPRIAALGGAGLAASPPAIASNGLCEGGSVISQGIDQLNVAAARAAFGARGAGETIGVISDSLDSATVTGSGQPPAATAHDDEVTNDLPGPASTCDGQQLPVRVIAAPPGEPAAQYTDEGRAILQIVHDLAPHAKLAFATGLPSEISFARNIERLAEPIGAGGAGADVIVDDLAYESEPFFQEGPVAMAIRRVTEAGVLYFAATGNDNLFDAAGNEIDSWEAPGFRQASSCSAAVEAALDEALAVEGRGPYEPDCMDFDPGPGVDTEFGITVEAGRGLTVDLQWAEPWFGVRTDLLAFLVAGSGAGEEVLASGGSSELPETPFVPLSWTNSAQTARTVRLVIARCAGPGCDPEASATADPPLKLALLENGAGVSETEYPRSEGGDLVGPTIYGHRGSTFVTAIGAVNYREPSTAPERPEPYSSRGPVTHYFGPVVGTAPAAPLGAPAVIAKPDLIATDCASTTFFNFLAEGAWHFCGTSEAVEHAAAVAALMRQTDPLAGRAEIVAALKATATPFSVVDSPAAVGAGMVDALAATEALGGAPVEDPPSHVVPSLEEEERAPPPVVRVTKGPPPLSSDNRPLFEFSSTRPVAFSCQIDGGTPRPCASPYLAPSPLADGAHGFTVSGTDAEGRAASSGIYAFTVDTRAPRTRIVGHPRKLVWTRGRSVRVGFRLWASESPVTIYCQFDREALRICPPRFHHRFGPGRHALKVRARDAAGNLAARPTVYRFRVKEPRRRHRARARHSR